MPLREVDLEFEGTTIHCYEGGSGYPLLMIHGSGPGTASASNWMHVMEPLSQHYRVCAMDLIGYGLSGRKRREPYFDTDMWVRQGKHLLDRIAKREPVGIIGHSLGGYLALRLGAEVERVDKVLAQGALGAKTQLNRAIDIAWTFPKNEAAFRKLYRYVTLDPSGLTEEFVQQRLAVLNRDGYGEYFSKMFKGKKQRYLDEAILTRIQQKKLARCKIVLLHGAQDVSVPFGETTLALGKMLPHADLVRLANCGHPCSFDQPEKFMKVARALFN
jgi:2-hydroxymuconate-semialdehyde hydrolase